MRPPSVILAAGILAGCAGVRTPVDPGIVCTAVAVSSLNVTVRDQRSGQPVCDATVTAIESNGTSHVLRPTGACTYAGPYERAGTFEVIASRSGYDAARVTGIRVTADECHVIPVSLVVDLRPGS